MACAGAPPSKPWRERWRACPRVVVRGAHRRPRGDSTMNAQQYESHAQLQALARSRGGACLSSEYRNAHHKMHWRCAEGHEWDAVASSVLRGRWCRVCSNETRHRGEKARTFSSVQAIAQEKGGRCLSTEYVDCRIQLSFRCAEGHEWAATAAMVRQGRWCPACVPRGTLKRQQDPSALAVPRRARMGRARGEDPRRTMVSGLCSSLSRHHRRHARPRGRARGHVSLAHLPEPDRPAALHLRAGTRVHRPRDGREVRRLVPGLRRVGPPDPRAPAPTRTDALTIVAGQWSPSGRRPLLCHAS